MQKTRSVMLRRPILILTGGLLLALLSAAGTILSVWSSHEIAVAVVASRGQVLREWETKAVTSAVQGGAMTGVLIAVSMLVSRLVAQLECERNAALAALKAKARFASNVSHELRTPMNAIIGGAHQLMETGLAPESRKFARIVSSAANQLMVLINGILDLSYYEARHFRVEPAPFDVRELARNVVDMARSTAPKAPVEISWIVTHETPAQLIGDSGRICQVLLNLLDNALKYTERGSVKLAVSYADGMLTFAVADTGRGIPAHEHARMFEAFERGVEDAARPGTGLGLAISKKLVEAMSGAIQLESAPGRGSRFTVRLPAPVAPGSKPGHSDRETSPHACALKVLIAEDVAPSRLLLQIMLEKMGHQVVAAENGLEAVARMRESDFDLVLMDLQMPELDGAGATKRIRALGGEKGSVRIIAVSANADLDGPEGLTAAGFDDVLLKPLTPSRLEFVIRGIAAAA